MTTLLSVVLLVTASSLLWPKKYTAKSVVMVDMKVDPIAGTSSAGVMPSAAYLSTQVDIIESKFVSQKVIQQLQLDANAKIREEWESAGSKGDFNSWLSDKILSNLKVEAARESNVIEINYSGVDPNFSAAMANAFAKSYIDSSVQFKTAPAKQYSDFFEERAKLAHQKMEATQNKLAEAQRDKGILVTDEKLDAETVKLNDLTAQLTALRGIVADASSRKTQGSTSGEVSPDAMNSSILLTLRSDLSRQDAKLDESLERYGENHPVIVELKANIAATKQKIREEVARVNGSLNASKQISISREETIRAAVEEQRQKLLQLKKDRNDILILERESQAAQRVYDAIQVRQSQMSLEGSNSQANIVVLNVASPPSTPSSPKVGLNIVISVVLGLFLACLFAMAAEFMDRRIRSSNDLVTLLRIPVIGHLPATTNTATSSLFQQFRPLHLTNRPSGVHHQDGTNNHGSLG
jgi:succinoglycan biosynthesis transport protein ExoP